MITRVWSSSSEPSRGRIRRCHPDHRLSEIGQPGQGHVGQSCRGSCMPCINFHKHTPCWSGASSRQRQVAAGWRWPRTGRYESGQGCVAMEPLRPPARGGEGSRVEWQHLPPLPWGPPKLDPIPGQTCTCRFHISMTSLTSYAGRLGSTVPAAGPGPPPISSWQMGHAPLDRSQRSMHRGWKAWLQGSRFTRVPGRTSSRHTTQRSSCWPPPRGARSTGSARIAAGSAPRRSSSPSSSARSAS